MIDHAQALRNVRNSIPAEIHQLVKDGALFACSTSGGKDSQVLQLFMAAIIPADQLVFIHADLGDIEWPGVKEHIYATIPVGAKLIVAQAYLKTGEPADFFDLVRRQQAKHERDSKDSPSWPDSKNRYCTSDLKTGPIWRELRRYAKEHGYTQIVNSRGIRAGESATRAKKLARGALKVNSKNTNQSRQAWDWDAIAFWPCHTDTNGQASDKSLPDIFEYIQAAGQKPHWAYADGNDRLSCMFCIFGSKNDLKHALDKNPDLYHRYAQLERETGYTMFNGESLGARIAKRQNKVIATDR